MPSAAAWHGRVSAMGTEQEQDDMLPLRQAAEGDEAAFAVIVRRMAPVTRTLTARYAAPGIEYEDLSQECMLGLLAAVRSYREGCGTTFTTYAVTCMRNRLVSFLRRSGKRLQLEQPLDSEDELPDTAETDPMLQVQRQEEEAQLAALLRQRLTPLEYRVLLSRLSDRSYRETAERLGISVRSVDNAVQRLRRKLSAWR